MYKVHKTFLSYIVVNRTCSHFDCLQIIKKSKGMKDSSLVEKF